jgi:hypothetical protein
VDLILGVSLRFASKVSAVLPKLTVERLDAIGLNALALASHQLAIRGIAVRVHKTCPRKLLQDPEKSRGRLAGGYVGKQNERAIGSFGSCGPNVPFACLTTHERVDFVED